MSDGTDRKHPKTEGHLERAQSREVWSGAPKGQEGERQGQTGTGGQVSGSSTGPAPLPSFLLGPYLSFSKD